ncbi:tRNA(Met) cytidine acetyltransferase TmcA [Pantoea trifolii]|uniref:tRNA(Met) cytidine acetyltransferase TmcA n=1 Tax=Pantoea trifolii TaxID=2968030 RepID=A0ABT1VM25_9GAMM|nr:MULTISPECIES: GNAT family N-acetyltransferase [unclassified Pantoea]MCQ8228590.1 GNAT family N-acetyltransferase [Pantoea sp. MMK2]MCQ8236763.1 GNAT family N-acetyltransferase [Pantoea sp. MMK3]
MQRAGIRRLCVIAGDAEWAQQQAINRRAALSGDWLTVSDSADFPQAVAPGALRTLLGREFQHAIFDARNGFHAEAFAALAGTLRAGSWLLLLTPAWESWPNQTDADSLRWADVAEPIATPHFIHHLQSLMLQDAQVMLQRQHQAVRYPVETHLPDWRCRAPQQQAQILEQLEAMPHGVAVITAARGRGKSALAGMLAQRNQHCLVTAPAKVSTAVLAEFAGEYFSFMAPDAILAQENPPQAQWLIVDEAAAIPAPILQQLVQRFPRVLLITTVEGYEGTGRGFMLRFCATLPDVRLFQLDEPLRWSPNDPLEQWLSQALLFEDAQESNISGEIAIYPATPEHNLQALEAGYRLLASAHYRTSPLDLRRMLDAPGMRLWLAGEADQVTGALWLVEEGGLDQPLVDAVWAGYRRPRGNLVAQSLAAHAGFAQAATLRSQRISRIAVQASQRQRGIGKALVATARQQAQGCDYLSVSFGYTESLWHFWRACGFTLVRIGSQREASSGCYAAMAMLATSAAGEVLQQQAAQRLARDWPWLRDIIELPLTLASDASQQLNDDDWTFLAGFAWAQRPFEASYAALQRLVRQSPSPLLNAILLQKQTLTQAAQYAGLSGRKALINQLRSEAAAALIHLNPDAAQRLRSLQ